MSCTAPIGAFQSRDGGVVRFSDFAGADRVELPCGRCCGCRLGRAQSWAIRCQHEAMLHDENCFLTLTYEDEFLPSWHRPRDTSRWRGLTEFGTLFYPDVQKFLRALRKQVAPKRFLFLCAGEYGERTARPHYHLLLFGHRFDCRLDFARAGVPGRLGESDQVDKVWKYGRHYVGELTAASAAYVSQYCLKKVYGREGESSYAAVDYSTGEVMGGREPEFLRMSLRPAIGRRWYEKYASDVLPRDYAISNGMQGRVPRYYEKLFRESNPLLMDEVEFQREIRLVETKVNRSFERRAAREEILRARIARNAERRTV